MALRLIPAGILMLTLIVPTLSWAEPTTVTAILGKVEPSDAITNGWVWVKRGAVKFPASLSMSIQAGDEILIKDKLTSVLLSLLNGQQKRVSQGESPYTFSISTPGVMDRFYKVANSLGLLKGISPTTTGTKTSASTGRGYENLENCSCGNAECTLLIPADNVDPIVKLVAGLRGLAFHWVGGTAPYQLRLLMNGEVIQEANKIEACQITLPSRHWQPGVYTLELKDPNSQNGWRDESVTFVEASAVPKSPAELQTADLSLDERTLLEADWLARQEKGAWRLEAVQRVAPLVGKHPLAEGWMQLWAYGQQQ